MNAETQRWRIGGRVQGVGYRPFVYRLAHSLNLSGWVRNDGGAVEIHAQGPAERLKIFGEALLKESPPAAGARLIDVRAAPAEAASGFVILPSTHRTGESITVPMDLYTCNDCVTELRDPTARRYRYPFINCTQCGPRYTLITKLPYDRINTTLEGFPLCDECQSEYSDPLDRRFHAQPLACASCGPALYWRGANGDTCTAAAALATAAAALRGGKIVAMRGVGGYHLLCDAANEQSVARLRERKGRLSKPFAVMVPSADRDGLGYVQEIAHVTLKEAAALCDRSRPIVLLKKRERANLADGVAPGLREVGVMLSYSPLHHLLLEDCGFALVATSGNVTGEVVLTGPEEATSRLSRMADGFLHHNRPIARPADDGVVRQLAGSIRPLRLGRGTSPLELTLATPVDVPMLGVGAHQKTTVTLAWQKRAVVSPHIGDLTSPRGRAVFAQVVHDLQTLYGITAERIVHDSHPHFFSTQWARDAGLPAAPVWHHHAHASALAGEYPVESPILCFTWDGLGLGPDQSFWGGEALLGGPGRWRRVASLREFRLPGGDRAAREPWRSALALCWESGLTWPQGVSSGSELLRRAFDSGINVVRTTSVGRLFDAAAAIVGICRTSSFEAEGPMRLESLCKGPAGPVTMPLARDAQGIWRSDWEALLCRMLDDRIAPASRAEQFHSSLAHALYQQALAVRAETGVNHVGLTGGVFQNRVLSEQADTLLRDAGFKVLIPLQLPMNDASISFGQIIEASAHYAA